MITKGMFIEDLVVDYPHLIGPLKDEGIVCLACGEPMWGTLEEQAKEKGIKNIDKIVEKMNHLLAEENIDLSFKNDVLSEDDFSD